MDGPRHPQQADASVVAKDDLNPFPADSSKYIASHAPASEYSLVKRHHSDEDEEPGPKRQHVVETDTDDLDLDALLAQLQQHTDQASIPVQEGAKDSQNKQQFETELSIEQQLKGALSSLQDLEVEGGDEDDNSDVEGAALALDQLSEILNSSKRTEEQQNMDPDSEASKYASFPQQNSSAAAEEQSKMPSHETQSSFGDPTTSYPSKESSKCSGTEPSNSRQALLARMPHPPAGASGTLPPMPPPPAALNSPTAPLTSVELSRGAFQSSNAGAGSNSRVLSSHMHRIYTPTFSEPPSLPKSYESALADQVDALSTKMDEGELEESHMALHLNDNQTVLQARQRSIPLLDSLAVQILDVLSFSHYQETLATVMQPESERGIAYRLLLDAFEDVKRLYGKWKTNSSRDKAEPKPDEVRPFLSHNIPGVEPSRQNITTLQRANLATFVAAIFGTIEIGFWELDQWFLKIFVPDYGRLLKQQANIYLDLKTQAYISAVESSGDPDLRSAALEHLFPDDLEAKMKDSLCERLILAPSEQDFVAKCHRRKENIKAENDQDLSAKYHWVPFLREVSDYISRNHYTLLPQRKAASGGADSAGAPGPVPASPRNYAPPRKHSSHSQTRVCETSTSYTIQAGADQETAQKSCGSAHDTEVQISSVKASEHGDPKFENENKSRAVSVPASTATQNGDKSPRTKSSESTTEQLSSTPKTRPDIPAEGHPLFPPLPKQVIPPPSLLNSDSQHHDSVPQQGYERSRRPGPRPHYQAPVAANNPADTLAVYEAAKASAEGTDAIRPKTSMFTTRRTWTKEEEEALLKGMDRVQGPYWAQILELYGPGGKISEVLKDRSQVQLKDKARNLKMFFLRLGLPIPAVFQYVTGDYEARRTSGKKVKERKQARLALSDLSHQTNSQLAQQRSSQQQPSIHAGPPLNDKPQQTSKLAEVGLEKANASRIRGSASSPPHDESASGDAISAQSCSQEKTLRSSLNDPLIIEKKDDSQKENKKASSGVDQGITTSTEYHNSTPSHNESPQPLSKIPPNSGDSSISQDKSEVLPHKSQSFSERTDAKDRKAQESQNGTVSIDNDEDDKEEDISAILNRMGEYVDNH